MSMSRTLRSQSISSGSFSAMPRPIWVVRYAAVCLMLRIFSRACTFLMSHPGLSFLNAVVSILP